MNFFGEGKEAKTLRKCMVHAHLWVILGGINKITFEDDEGEEIGVNRMKSTFWHLLRFVTHKPLNKLVFLSSIFNWLFWVFFSWGGSSFCNLSFLFVLSNPC